jgi:hypothetical protein
MVLDLHCSPDSPFFGMIDFDELFALSIEDQKEVYDAMSPKLANDVESFKENYENRNGSE